MDLLWSSKQPLSAYDLIDQVPFAVGAGNNPKKHAATTMLTVLSRLEKKGFVERERASRPHRYSALGSREEHVAELMRQVLGTVDDPAAVLERFVGQVSASEADTLRRLLG